MSGRAHLPFLPLFDAVLGHTPFEIGDTSRFSPDCGCRFVARRGKNGKMRQREFAIFDTDAYMQAAGQRVKAMAAMWLERCESAP